MPGSLGQGKTSWKERDSLHTQPQNNKAKYVRRKKREKITMKDMRKIEKIPIYKKKFLQKTNPQDLIKKKIH